MERVLVSRRVGWISNAIIGGFVATVGTVVGLLVAYAVAIGLSQTVGGVVGSWFVGLTHNLITQAAQNAIATALILHFSVGLVWAVVYVAYFEPHLQGPGWRKGMEFSLVPWFLSLAVFFPLIGGGFFGLSLGAGPLPIVGNLVLHLLYGAILGEIYALGDLRITADDWFSARDTAANAGAEHGVAVGVIAGGVVGAILAFFAGVILSASGSVLVPPWLLTLAGLGVGMFVGSLIGSFLGLGDELGA